MREFDYLEPASIAEASEMLAAHAENCRMMAGGTALMLALRQRMMIADACRSRFAISVSCAASPTMTSSGFASAH